ncbi:Y-family DNA polymerase [Pseudonocardia humida]|uniref:DNA polymerase IV n=1 Tax=Pseudonocardia humida TaxID=2800819 RepID=A0ABT1A7D2_9PSEU|nr:DNA polymerase IV [Pseudonocardia humida]MCO1658914.1 DNA polymerase IV [Pseudonocardia humida]
MTVPGGPPLLHVDADAFFASVELRDDPSLRGLPMAVADVVVMCASYPARLLGVRAGVPTRMALLDCPQLVTVRPRPQVYERVSRELFALLGEVAATVEPGSMEEAFLDVPGLAWSDAADLGTALRARVRDELGLPVSVGVGRTKLIAKLASRAAKPDGLRVVDPATEARLRPALRVDRLWGVGARTLDRLRPHDVTTVADLARYSPDELCAMVGTAMGRRLHAVVTGTDDATVRVPGPRRSVSAQRVPVPPARHAAELRRLAATVAERLTAEGLACRRLELADTRGARVGVVVLPEPTAAVDAIVAAALSLLPAPVDARGLRLTAARLSRRERGCRRL